MIKKITTLAKDFIAIPSDPDNRPALEDILMLATEQVSEFSIEYFERNGCKSALVYNTNKRPERFNIILNGHLDIIPGKEEQYKPYVNGDKLYGVGAMDMKGNLASLIYAFKNVAKKVNYPLGLQLVTDEELGGFDGTQYQVEEGIRADFVISSEPTQLDIVHQAKGVIWLEIIFSGKSAHGAYPWRGKNALWKAHTFLTDLKKLYPTPKKESWVTTVNLSKITTNNKSYNKIPDDALVCLDVRFIPEEKDLVLKNIESLLPEDTKLKILAHEPALFVPTDNSFVLRLKDVATRFKNEKVELYGAQGSSDARHYARVGGFGVEFGPVGEGIGSDDEWVSLKSLETYYNIISEFLLSYNS